MPVFRSSRKNSDEYYYKIFTVDAELQFAVESTARGEKIFSLVCQTLGLRENWYFGLRYLNNATNEWSWLQLDRTITSEPIQILPISTTLDSCSSSNPANNFSRHLLRSAPTSISASSLNLPSTTVVSSSKSIRGVIELYFAVKFYPEEITHELIQDVTRRLFYSQVKQDILNMNIYCPPDTAAHLASLSLQTKFGDYDHIVTSSESLNLENEALLPISCFQKVELSRSDWFDRIIALWRTHASLTPEESEMAYLKHAQDLDMFGLSFFEIQKMKGSSKSSSQYQLDSIGQKQQQKHFQRHHQQYSDQPSLAADLWLGIDSLGIRFYKRNKLRPEVFFSWCDIRFVTGHNKKIILNLTKDKSATFAFYAERSSISKEILDLAAGNHELYMKRRQEQSIEMQQMRYFEDRQQKERRRLLAQQRSLRLQAEQRCAEIQSRLTDYEQQMKEVHETLAKYQEANELLAHRAYVNSEEARLQAAKVQEVEAQLECYKYEIGRNEEDKRLYARQIYEFEQVISTLANDSIKNRKEADELKLELTKWRVAEAAAREQLLQMTQLNQSVSQSNTSSYLQQNLVQSSPTRTTPVSPPPYRPIKKAQESNSNDERGHFIDKQSKQTQLALQLQDLKNEIQSKKIEDRQTLLDKAYEEGLALGDNKYSSIQRAQAGTTSRRMAMLQDL